MHRTLRIAIVVATVAILGGGASFAEDVVTATCKDGSTWSGAHRRGACRGHGGVQAFDSSATAPTASPTPATPMAPPSSPVAPSATPATLPRTNARPMGTPAPGGGPGQVWVNTASKVYHCAGDRYYGNTKRGGYMTEAAAKAAGDRPDHGKTCS